MADGINFNLLGVGEPSPYQQAQARDLQNQLVQQQLATGRMQQETAQMNLAQAKRDQAALAKLQETFVANGKSPDLEANFRAMMESGIQHYVDIGMKGMQMLEGQRRFRELIGGNKPAAAAAQTAPQSFNAPANLPEAKPSIMWQQPANALAQPTPAATAQNKLADMENKIAAAYEIGTPASIAWAQAREKELGELRKPQVVAPGASVFQGGESVFTAPEKAPTKPEIVREYEYAKENGYKGSLFDFKRELASAGRQPAQPSAPVAVVDPVTGKSVFVSREEAINRKLSPASAQESLPPKEIQKREASFPQATSALKGFEAKSESFIKDLKALRDHPGLSEITGFVAGRVPGITADGRAAQALYDKVVAKGGFQALQDMRDASKTGGALGNVSNQEGKQLTASFAAIDRRQNAEDVRAALDEAINNVEGARVRMREAYDATYSYRNAGEPAAPAPAPRVAAPTVGTVKDGYTFKGGNPADKNNWEKVK